MSRAKPVKWTPEADAFVCKVYPMKKWTSRAILSVLSSRFGLTVSGEALHARANRMGVKKYAREHSHAWTPETDALLVQLFEEGMIDDQVVLKMNEALGLRLTLNAVRMRRLALGKSKGHHVRWTEEARAILREMYGLETHERIAAAILKQTGLPITKHGVNKQVQTLGLDMLLLRGHLTLPQAAEELGIKRTTLGMYMSRKGLSPVGRGKTRFVDEETMEALRKAFPVITEPVMTTPEVAAALGFTQNTIARWVLKGQLSGHRFGLLYKIPVAAVEAKRRDLGISRPLPQTFGRQERKASA